MLSTIFFIAILAGPFILFLISALSQKAKTTGILGGIKMPKSARTTQAPGVPPAARPAKAPKMKRTTMRARRVTYCGKGLSHFALGLVGSEDACRYCGRLETVAPLGSDDDEAHAAVAEVEQLLDRGQH